MRHTKTYLTQLPRLRVISFVRTFLDKISIRYKRRAEVDVVVRYFLLICKTFYVMEIFENLVPLHSFFAVENHLKDFFFGVPAQNHIALHVHKRVASLVLAIEFNPVLVVPLFPIR